MLLDCNMYVYVRRRGKEIKNADMYEVIIG